MITHTATTETKTELKPKKKQVQPKHHASKSRVAAQARRKIIANALLDGKTTMEAGLLAGLSPKTADSQVSKILNHPQTQSALLAAMAAKGIDDDYLAEHHQRLIEGTKVISANFIVSGGGSELKEAGSIIKDFIEVPDFVAKAKGLEMAYKLTGRFIDKHELDIKRPVSITIKKFCSRG